MLRRLRDSTIERRTLLTLVIGPALLEDICVRCSVEVGLGLDRKAVMVWLTPSASINCSRSSIFVLPLATVCCVHAVGEKAFRGCGGYERRCQRDIILYKKTVRKRADDVEVRGNERESGDVLV